MPNRLLLSPKMPELVLRYAILVSFPFPSKFSMLAERFSEYSSLAYNMYTFDQLQLKFVKSITSIALNILIQFWACLMHYCFRLLLAKIDSKTRVKVPVLLLPHVADSIRRIIRIRLNYTDPKNVYVFGLPNSKKSYMGWTALNAVSKSLDLKDREAVTSTKIRKYIASTSQVQ